MEGRKGLSSLSCANRHLGWSSPQLLVGFAGLVRFCGIFAVLRNEKQSFSIHQMLIGHFGCTLPTQFCAQGLLSSLHPLSGWIAAQGLLEL